MKKMTVQYVAPLLALALLLSVVVYKRASPTPRETAKAAEKRPPLRLGYSYWTGYYPFPIAKEKGFFAQQGVDVELVFVPDVNEQLPDFVAGKYDGFLFVVDALLRVVSKNSDVRVVCVPGQSAGADVVVAKQGIENISDLRGKKIAARVGSFSEMFVGEMLAQNGLSVDDVTLINADESAVPPYLANDTIQAGHTWEPYSSQAVKAGGRVVFTSKQTPGVFPDVIIFRGSVLRERPDDVRALFRAWYQAVDYWDAHPKEASEIIGRALKLPPEEVTREGYESFSVEDTRKLFPSATDAGALSATVNRFVDFFIKKGALGHRPDVSELLDPSFLPTAATPR
jgi:NitT/TauT family transport system substrate-binding protein